MAKGQMRSNKEKKKPKADHNKKKKGGTERRRGARLALRERVASPEPCEAGARSRRYSTATIRPAAE